MRTQFLRRYYFWLLLFSSSSVFADWREDELPIVAVHGIMSKAAATKPMRNRFEQAGIYFYPVEIGNRGLDPIPEQGKRVWNAICRVFARTGKKVNIVCHSQGNIASRYAIQHYQDPANPLVNNVIGLAGPNAGIYDLPGNFDEWIDAFINDRSVSWSTRMMRKAILGWAYFGLSASIEHAYKLFYLSMIQENLSFSNYFKDPLHYDQYLKYCKVLPYLNNEKPHKRAYRYKANILAINEWILVQSKGATSSSFDQDSRDRIITPAASAHLGFFKVGSNRDEDIVDVWAQYDSVIDPLGIAYKFAQNKLHFIETPEPIAHTDFWEDEATFKMIVPYLIRHVDDFFECLYSAIVN